MNTLKKDILVIFLFLVSLNSLGRDIDIGVFRGHSIQQIDFSYYQGDYLIQGDSTSFGRLQANEFVSIIQHENGVELKKGVRSMGRFDTIYLRPTIFNAGLRLRPRSPVLKARKYRDEFRITAGKGGLTIVNRVSYTHYLGGVIESEGGGGKDEEYYKAQAVISRTYALKHINKHQNEGFDLCDQVHCQAYHNMLIYTDEIKDAVKATAGIFMVDTLTNQLVESYFHANCGGETSSTSFVWQYDIAYLQPFKDTFCIYSSQAHWTKKIPKTKWRKFLINEYFYPIQDPEFKKTMYTFQQSTRKAFYVHPSLGIPLRDIRYHFKLKSTFFSCHPEGQNVVVEGRGYGHGVGLCQEGAMSMDRQGIAYEQILSYYYSGIRLDHFFENQFFQQTPKNALDF